MLTDIVIKSEPLDIEETELVQPINNNDIKVEFESIGNTHDNYSQKLKEYSHFIMFEEGDFNYQKRQTIISAMCDRNSKCSSQNNCIKGGTLQHSCSACHRTFNNETSLLKHLNLHHENYFFCKENCGVSFKYLHECQRHEYYQHKYKGNQIKRIKFGETVFDYICSFCRKYFNTELQLHVHWLNKDDNICGKLMHEIIVQLNEILTNKAKNNTTNVQMPTIPITKLRLKIPPTNATLDNSYEQSEQMIDQNVQIQSSELNVNMKPLVIKEEPLDENSNSDKIQTPHEVETNTIISEIQMKPDMEHNEIDKNEDAHINCKKANVPEIKVQTIPSMGTLLIINNNQSQCNGIDAKNTSLNVQNMKCSPDSVHNHYQKSLSMPMNGVQVIRLPPNTQIMKLPINRDHSANTNNTLNEKTTLNPVVIKTQPSQLQCSTSSSLIVTTIPKSNLTNNGDTVTKGVITQPPPLIFNKNPAPQISSSNTELKDQPVSVEHNKNTSNTKVIEEKRKNFVISKDRLKTIESLPENKEIIESMIEQIKQVENNLQYDNNTEELQKLSQINASVTPPPSVFVPLHSTTDLDLVQARRTHKDYHYRLLCPYCQKPYELKATLRMHLLRAHNLVAKDLNKICVQAKPFHVHTNLIVKNNDNNISNNLSNLETLNGFVGEIITDTNKQSKSTSKWNIQKNRYRCDRCNRYCSSKAMLNDHILANCSREPLYPCPRCTKKFYSSSTLQCHMSIHTGELPHKCLYCEKRFRTRGQVTVHHRTHTGERPFICQVCSLRFTHRETLIAHLSRHIGMKRYKCYGCDKHFSCISALKTHREIRPQTCGKVKFNARAIGPRVRVVRGNVIFEAQPEINPYLRSEDPKEVLAELANNQIE